MSISSSAGNVSWKRTIVVIVGADSTGATGNFAPVLTQEPGQTLHFASVPYLPKHAVFGKINSLLLINPRNNVCYGIKCTALTG